MADMVLDNIKAVIVDLDDTLYSEKEFVFSGFKAVSSYLQKTGIVKIELFDFMWNCFESGKSGKIFNDALKSENLEPEKELVASLVEVYRLHKPNISPFPDAIPFLEKLYNKKMLGLLTDGYLTVQKNKVNALGIEKYFDIIVYTDELGRNFWKPHKAGYEKIMNELSVSGKECLYVGDNPVKDFYSAKKLGWKTIRIKRPGGVYCDKEAATEKFAADDVLENLRQII